MQAQGSSGIVSRERWFDSTRLLDRGNPIAYGILNNE